LNQITVFCQDKYESQKLVSLIFVKETKETYFTEILNVIENEIILSIKDKSAHSIVFKDNNQVAIFVDFIQSVIEKKHKIIDARIMENSVEIIKG
tara:strand:+ start:420 stop:704 length:285 start_codon:yes stop_codon:yes gene_type:complete